MPLTKTVILLLVCLSGVRSWQDRDSAETADEHSAENVKCAQEKSTERYGDNTEATCRQSAVLVGENEAHVSEKACVDDTECGTLVDEEDDQSALLMLGQEEQEFSTQDSTASEECSHYTPETDVCESVQSSTDLPKEENRGELSVESDAGGSVPLVQDAGESDLTEGDEKSIIVESNVDLPATNESTKQLPEKESEPEQENVPLREILLKLKPEGLTDEEDEQSSDYSASESNAGEESEIEEEALVSSGSTEDQEQTPDSNATKGSVDGSGANTSAGSKKAVCLELNATDPINDVEIINSTALLKLLQVDPNVTSISTSGPCYLVYFFSPYCPFSIMGSPYVNALARSVPNIPVFGMDSIEHHSVNAWYGVMGTPTLLLFHNGNGVGRYNASEYSVSQLMSFIRHYTDQELTDINVTSSDFRAKLPSQLAEARPYALWAAWTFLLSFASWLFVTSDLCARLTEAVLNNWREAEAQNDHQD